MIIWGGNGATYLNDGGVYNPGVDLWVAVTLTGAPAPRIGHTAIWRGSEMIVWGGFTSSSVFNDGARLNPFANAWTSVSINAGPSGRSDHTAVWTGTEMIVFGGSGPKNSFLNDTFGYVPTRALYLYQRP
jgi:N-acetylneuraminic acid mutarotase